MDSEKYLLAKRTYYDKKHDEAYTYFSEVLSNDEKDYMSVLYRGFCYAFKTTLTKPYHPNLISSFKDAYAKISEDVYKSDKYKMDSLEIMEEVNKFIVYCLEMYYNKFTSEYDKYKEDKKKIEDYVKFSGAQGNVESITENTNKVNERYAKAIIDLKAGTSLTIVTFNSILNYMLSNVMKNEYEIYSLDDYIRIKVIIESLYNRFKSLKTDENHLNKTNEFFTFVSEKVDKYEEENKNKYWSEHQEEKDNMLKSMEEDKQSIEAKQKEIEELQTKLDSMDFSEIETPSLIKRKEVEGRLELLINQMNNSGRLDLKTKKLYENEKAKLESIIRGLTTNVNIENESAKIEFEKEKKDLETTINNLQNDIVNLKRNIAMNELKLNERR